MTYFISSGNSAKQAFLSFKQKLKDSNILEEYNRYKIASTIKYSLTEALTIYNVEKNIPIEIRNKCLVCFLLEDDQYLFYTPTRIIKKPNV